MAGSSLLLLALVIGLLGTTWGLLRAEQARQSEAQRAEGERRANQQAQAAQEAERMRETAQTRDAETRAVLDFVENNVFAAARPADQDGGLGHDVTLRQAIQTALPLVARSFTDQPLIEARLRMTLAMSFSYLGEVQAAAEQDEIARGALHEVSWPGPARYAALRE